MMHASYASLSETTATPVVRRECDCGGSCADCAREKRLGDTAGVRLGARDDPLERQADRMADAVMAGDTLQRETMEEDEEQTMQAKPEALQRETEEDEEEDRLQMKSTGTAAAPSAAVPAAAAVSGGGSPLPTGERAFFEPRFGRDLSHVRIHADARAADAAHGIGARAFTLRNHIAFATGQYRPGNSESRRLMAHELTHALQQDGARTLRRRSFGGPGGASRPGRDPMSPGLVEDPRGPGASTLTYAQSRELSRCIEVMGESDVARAECANLVLGTPIPEWKSVAGISSPVPFRARVSEAGVATHRIGPVNLTILPDAHSADQGMANRAETTINFAPLPQGQNLVDFVTQNGRITSFTFNQDLNSLTIQTTYGPGATAAGPSGYGRGTTQADQAVGRTSLGFHEGEHGRDFITFLQNNPYPEFEGRIGQERAVFVRHVHRFQNAVQQYIRRMSRESLHATDCVGGTTVDESNRASGQITQHCRGAPRRP